VRALTAAGRSASMPRRRLGTEITHCRTGTDSRRRSGTQTGSGKWSPGTSSRFRPVLVTCSWIGPAGTFSGVAGLEVRHDQRDGVGRGCWW
jgi:hypothetical protein